jgi:CheY-like chemotaxis protein
MNPAPRIRLSPVANQIFSTPPTILVVDDQHALCEIAGILLRRCGYRVLTANSGEQAKDVARRNPRIDLLLTDVEMPDMLGDELAKWFHANAPGMPVVFMSGNRMQHQRLRPCRFVDKPFVHLDILLNTIREALSDCPLAPSNLSKAA